MKPNQTAKPGVRLTRNGQYVPTLDGKDISPTSFEESRALEIATQAANQTAATERNPYKLNENAAGDIWIQNGGCLKAKMENFRKAKEWAQQTVDMLNEHSALLAVAEAAKVMAAQFQRIRDLNIRQTGECGSVKLSLNHSGATTKTLVSELESALAYLSTIQQKAGE